MNGHKVKQIRWAVYGADFSPRERQYEQDRRGVIRCIGLRRMYQQAKAIVGENRRGEKK